MKGAAPVDPGRWAEASKQLDELLELDAAARDARLAEIARGDAALAGELRSLLEQQTAIEREHFLDGSALAAGAAGNDLSLAGRTIGAYTLQRPLGAGGMGSVWLAERSDGRFEGSVAVKLLNLAMLGRGGAERFAREGNVLARLSHPHIAKLLDAGVTDSGQPYLVLEHVEGEPIDAWCDARQLGIEARVRLAIDVLGAVAHAHSKLVLHRDLKPGNIFVTRGGEVKLLDFGIAKLLDDESRPMPATELTQLAGRAFTPDYAAPEQVEGGDVTTATDVYALGVLLYVLLGGGHPTMRAAHTPVERLRSVLDTEPLPLSEAAALGRTTLRDPKNARALRGDLDNIVAKALKKSPAERYPTAAALADDLRRYLADEPVGARSDTFGYRAAKFVRRHRLGVAAASIAALALVGGIVVTTQAAIEARQQRAEAEQQRDRAQVLAGRNEAIVGFVDVMFTEALPAGQAAVVQQMLERSERLIGTVYAGEPAHQAEILRVLASYYTTLNLPNRNAELLARARQIVEHLPARSLKARLACSEASALALLGKPDEALAILAQWMDAPGLEAPVAAGCLQARAIIAQNTADAPAALRYAQAALARLADAPPHTLPLLEATLHGDLAFAHHLAGDNAAADREYQQSLERLAAFGRGASFEAGRMTVDRGIVRYAMSDFAGGIALFEQAIRIAETRGDPTIPPAILGNLAFGYEQLGRWPEALDAYERTLQSAQRNGLVSGQAYALIGRAAVLAARGQGADAQASLDEADKLLAGLPESHAVRLRHIGMQARLQKARGELAEADASFGRVIARLAAHGVTSHPGLANAHRERAEVALLRRDAPAALADARKAIEMARALQGGNAHSDLTGRSWLTLGRALRANGDAKGAREALAAAQAELTATLGGEHDDTRAAVALLRED